MRDAQKEGYINKFPSHTPIYTVPTQKSRASHMLAHYYYSQCFYKMSSKHRILNLLRACLHATKNREIEFCNINISKINLLNNKYKKHYKRKKILWFTKLLSYLFLKIIYYYSDRSLLQIQSRVSIMNLSAESLLV